LKRENLAYSPHPGNKEDNHGFLKKVEWDTLKMAICNWTFLTCDSTVSPAGANELAIAPAIIEMKNMKNIQMAIEARAEVATLRKNIENIIASPSQNEP